MTYKAHCLLFHHQHHLLLRLFFVHSFFGSFFYAQRHTKSFYKEMKQRASYIRKLLCVCVCVFAYFAFWYFFTSFFVFLLFTMPQIMARYCPTKYVCVSRSLYVIVGVVGISVELNLSKAFESILIIGSKNCGQFSIAVSKYTTIVSLYL